MLRRLLILAVTLAALALPASALAGGGDYGFEGAAPAALDSARRAQRKRVRLEPRSPARDDSRRPLRRLPFHARRHLARPGVARLGPLRLGDGDGRVRAPDRLPGSRRTRVALSSRRSSGTSAWCYGSEDWAHEATGYERFACMVAWAYWPSKNNSYRPTSPTDESAARCGRPSSARYSRRSSACRRRSRSTVRAFAQAIRLCRNAGRNRPTIRVSASSSTIAFRTCVPHRLGRDEQRLADLLVSTSPVGQQAKHVALSLGQVLRLLGRG